MALRHPDRSKSDVFNTSNHESSSAAAIRAVSSRKAPWGFHFQDLFRSIRLVRICLAPTTETETQTNGHTSNHRQRFTRDG